MKLSLTILFLTMSLFLRAQDFSGNACGEALSGAMTSQSGLYASGYNPAGLLTEKFSASVSYFDRYQLKEVSQKSATVVLKALNGCFSADFNYYGFKLFNRIQSGLGYSMKLSDKIRAGVKLNYHTLRIGSSCEKFNAVSGEAGVILSPVKNFDIASYIKNITNSQFNSTDTVIPVTIATGIRYKFYGNRGFVALEGEKSSVYDKIGVKFGAGGSLNKFFEVYGGLSTFPFSVSAGFGFTFDTLKILTAVRRNEFLGYMPSVSVGWNFDSRKSFWQR